MGRVSFPAIGKKPKDRRGRLTSPSGTSSLRLQFVLPRAPVYGGYPYALPQKFRRAKYGSGYDSFRATGPWCRAKFWPAPFYNRAWFRPVVEEGAGRVDADPSTMAAAGGPQRKAQRSGFALERRSDEMSEPCPAGRSEGYAIRDAEDPPANFLQQRLEPERSGAPFWSRCPGRLDFGPAAAAARMRGQSLSLPRLTVPQRPPELGPRKFRGSGGGATMGGDAHRSPPPAAFCLLCRRGQRRSPRRAKPCKVRRAESSRPTGVMVHGGRAATRGRPYGDPRPLPRYGGRGKPPPLRGERGNISWWRIGGRPQRTAPTG